MRLVESRSGIRKTLLPYGAALALILLIESCTSTSTTVILLPEKDGRAASVSVGEGVGAVVLDKPLTGAVSDTSGAVRQIDMTLEEVSKMFADALAAQPPEPIKYTLYFISGGTDLTPDSQPHIDTIINELAKRQAAEVEITGHTDRVGSVADNDRLSLQRAEAVLKILLQRGMKAGSFKHVVGRGEREPLIPTADDVAEPRNRRVEVIVR